MKKLWLLTIPALVIFLDQWLKLWTERNIGLYEAQVLIPGVLGLTHYRNEGAAFGILEGLRWPLVVVTLLALGLALVAVLRKWVTHPMGLLTLAGVVGGAMGNLIDRVRQGFVVDMFEFRFVNFAVFNVADVFLVVCGILFCVYWLLLHDHKLPDGTETCPDVFTTVAEPRPEDDAGSHTGDAP